MISNITIFLYGLFMDEALLASQNIYSAKSDIGFIDGYSLQIGERATLVPDPLGRVYGVLMHLSEADVARLYSDPSVADYMIEQVMVTVANEEPQPAVCYILPMNEIKGANPLYAAKLHAVAEKIGFPDEYLRQIWAAS